MVCRGEGASLLIDFSGVSIGGFVGSVHACVCVCVFTVLALLHVNVRGSPSVGRDNETLIIVRLMPASSLLLCKCEEGVNEAAISGQDATRASTRALADAYQRLQCSSLPLIAFILEFIGAVRLSLPLLQVHMTANDSQAAGCIRV